MEEATPQPTSELKSFVDNKKQAHFLHLKRLEAARGEAIARQQQKFNCGWFLWANHIEHSENLHKQLLLFFKNVVKSRLAFAAQQLSIIEGIEDPQKKIADQNAYVPSSLELVWTELIQVQQRVSSEFSRSAKSITSETVAILEQVTREFHKLGQKTLAAGKKLRGDLDRSIDEAKRSFESFSDCYERVAENIAKPDSCIFLAEVKHRRCAAVAATSLRHYGKGMAALFTSFGQMEKDRSSALRSALQAFAAEIRRDELLAPLAKSLAESAQGVHTSGDLEGRMQQTPTPPSAVKVPLPCDLSHKRSQMGPPPLRKPLDSPFLLKTGLMERQSRVLKLWKPVRVLITVDGLLHVLPAEVDFDDAVSATSTQTTEIFTPEYSLQVKYVEFTFPSELGEGCMELTEKNPASKWFGSNTKVLLRCPTREALTVWAAAIAAIRRGEIPGKSPVVEEDVEEEEEEEAGEELDSVPPPSPEDSDPPAVEEEEEERQPQQEGEEERPPTEPQQQEEEGQPHQEGEEERPPTEPQQQEEEGQPQQEGEEERPPTEPQQQEEEE